MGSVSDGFGHPVAGVRVVLEQRIGGRWKRVGSDKADSGGSFLVRAGEAGRYRVVVALAGFSAASKPIRAGR